MIGPVQIEAKVHFVVDDNQLGCAVVGLTVGNAVTEAEILHAIGQTLTAAKQQFAKVELMDANTFFNAVVVAERTGRRGRFAVPASFQFDVERVAEDALATVTKESE